MAAWARAGAPGGTAAGSLGGSFPSGLAGLALGGWAFDDPLRAPEPSGWPGAGGARPWSAWYDSLAADAFPVPVGGGLDLPLVLVTAHGTRPALSATRGVFSYDNGPFGQEGASLLLQRGDSLRWAMLDAGSVSRSGAGAYGPAGRHRWGVAGGWARGAQRLEAAFAERGFGQRLESFEGEDARGESARLAWSLERRATRAGVRLEREWDARSSFASGIESSRRDFRGSSATAFADRGRGRVRLSARVRVEAARVRRDLDPAFDLRGNRVEGGVRAGVALGDGVLSLDAGAGRREGTGPARLTPAARYAFDDGSTWGAVSIGRRPVTVWADLAPGESPFVQDSWVYAIEAGARRRDRAFVRGSLVLGSTRDRALVARLPIEDEWRRLGALRSGALEHFLLASAAAEWRRRSLRFGADVFALDRDRLPGEPAVDPAAGFRGFGEASFRAFSGDLGMRFRIDATGVGARETESDPSRRLPAYVTWSAGVSLTLGDALIVIRARNLEDEPREQPWIDLATGREALGGGREIQTSLTWKLFD